jgi:hypothetical protein
MLKYLFAASVLIGTTNQVFSEETTTYLLSLPFGMSNSLISDRCTRAAEIGGGFCDTVNLPVPGSSETAPVTFYFHIGQLNQIYETNRADFVPWPWSDSAPSLTDDDFIENPIVPVIANPCLFTDCAPGSSCVWSADNPFLGAQCISDPGLSYERPPLGGYLSMGSIQRLQSQMQLLSDGAVPPPDKPDLDLCGQLQPGKVCMGTYILDEQGRIWMIP